MARSIRTDIETNGTVDFLSKPILRTNQKLTSNIKLVVDDDNMYLESFDATDQLASSKYKKHLVKESGSYAYDVARFWNKNNIHDNMTPGINRNAVIHKFSFIPSIPD